MRATLFALALAAAVTLTGWGTPSARAQPAAAERSGSQPDSGDKSGYHLFNPTPRELMREMSTDRPDKTESPYTVDAGHLQWEMDFATFTQDRTGGERTRTWNVAPVNFKIGLLNRVDLQFVFDSYLRESVRADGATRVRSGVGDFTTRVKINLWGNDGGPTAFAMMPFLKFPTNSAGLGNNGVEGGLILPLAVELPWGWKMGLQTEADFTRNSENSGYHAEFVNSMTFGHRIVGDLSGYIEFFSAVSTERDAGWIGTVDLGLTYAVTDDIQLDGGVNLGVTRAADDLNPFVGLSWRF